MLEPTTDSQNGLLTRVVDWFAARMRASSERNALTRDDITEMAHDLGLCEADLRDVLPGARDNTRLMDAMMRARGLDPMLVSQMSAAVMRDLELTCTRCGAVGRCKHDLAAGIAAAHCNEFCANAETFDALLE
jgi:hypothetical protein